jgi:hypothetical protein
LQVSGSGFQVSGFGLQVSGFGVDRQPARGRVEPGPGVARIPIPPSHDSALGSGFRVSGLVFRVSGLGFRVDGWRFGVYTQGLRFWGVGVRGRVEALGWGVRGLGLISFRV